MTPSSSRIYSERLEERQSDTGLVRLDLSTIQMTRAGAFSWNPLRSKRLTQKKLKNQVLDENPLCCNDIVDVQELLFDAR